MSLIVRAFPLRAAVEEVKAFAAALAARKAETDAFYRQFGVSHESWHLQHTSRGPWLISVTKAENPTEAAPRYARSALGFDTWFKREVLRLSGVDPDQEPLGPPTALVFSWSDERVAASNLCA
jgi:hypothetical protein